MTRRLREDDAPNPDEVCRTANHGKDLTSCVEVGRWQECSINNPNLIQTTVYS